MNLTNLLDYANSIYHFDKEINSVARKNKNSRIKPSTALKMLTAGIVTKTPSINSIYNASFNSKCKRFNSIFKRGEMRPKTHALRDCINDIDYSDIQKIHYNILDKLKENKFFSSHNYRGKNVAILDGVEAFETHKNIEGLHKRNHKDGQTGYYFKSLGIMYITDDVDIILDLMPFEEQEVKDDKNNNDKIKSEGEITVAKRVIPTLGKYNIEIAVMDCMFLNAPCFNIAKENGIDVIVKMTDTRRDLYKDASLLFKKQEPCQEYEIVELTELTKVKYSKESKKKDTCESRKYVLTREVTDMKLNKSIITEETTKEHPKKIVYKKTTEKVVKRIKIWSDIFEMNNYDKGNVRVIKTEETTKEKTEEMYIVTTLLNENLEFIVDLMHKRWNIELKGFRKLKSRYNFNHLYIGTDNAIRLISYLMLIIYNFIELYFNIHTKKYKYKINFDNLLEEYKIEIANNKGMYMHFP